MSEPMIRFKGDRNPDGTVAEFHEGVPARHLSADDYEALPKELREVVRTSNLYDYAGFREVSSEAKAEAAKAEAAKAEESAAHHASATRAKEAK